MISITVPPLWQLVEIAPRKGLERPQVRRYDVLAVLSDQPPMVWGWLIDHDYAPGLRQGPATLVRFDTTDDQILSVPFICLSSTTAARKHAWVSGECARCMEKREVQS